MLKKKKKPSTPPLNDNEPGAILAMLRRAPYPLHIPPREPESPAARDQISRTINKKVKRWQLQEAKAHLSRLVKDAQKAPQVITVHGQETVIVQSISEFNKQNKRSTKSHPDFLEALLDCPPGPDLVIERDRNDFGREIPDFE